MLVTPLQRETINLRSHRRAFRFMLSYQIRRICSHCGVRDHSYDRCADPNHGILSDAPLPSNMPTNVTSTLLKVTVHSEADF